jgi:hypothetical protein
VSWNFAILKFAASPESPSDAAPGERAPLGSRAEVRAAIGRSFPGVEWHGDYGVWSSDHAAIEFDTCLRDPTHELLVHVVRGDVVSRLLDLCEANAWRALDFTDPLHFMSRAREAARADLSAEFRDRFTRT